MRPAGAIDWGCLPRSWQVVLFVPGNVAKRSVRGLFPQFRGFATFGVVVATRPRRVVIRAGVV
eukprot:11208264-Lingulodinium_polyedra.AAC.1